MSVPFKIPGPGWLSSAQIVACEEGEPPRLLEPATIRGIECPQGTEITIEPEFRDICLKAPVPLKLRGWELPAGREIVIFNLVSVPFRGFAAFLLNVFRNLVLSPLGVVDVGRTAWVHLSEPLSLHGLELPSETRLFFRPDGSLELRPGEDCRIAGVSAQAQAQLLVQRPGGTPRLLA